MAQRVPVFSQQQMKLTSENLKEECREGRKEKAMIKLLTVSDQEADRC